MKIIVQLCIIFAVSLLAVFISGLLPFPFPAGGCAMLLMFGALSLKLLRAEQLGETADFMLSNMTLFFIPSGVGIVAHYDLLSGRVLILLLICAATSAMGILAAAYAVKLTYRLQNRARTKGAR